MNVVSSEISEVVCKNCTTDSDCKLGSSCKFVHKPQISTNKNNIDTKNNIQPCCENDNVELLQADIKSNLNPFCQPFVPENRNRETKTRLCFRFANTGNCPYGEKCKFAHISHIKNVEDVNNKMFREYSSSLMPCPYYFRGYCRLDSKCRYSHAMGQAKNSTTNMEEQKMSKSVKMNETKNSVEIINKNVYKLDSIDEKKLEEFRQTEIQQFLKRYPKAYSIEKKIETYFFVFASSDPDWPFDVSEVPLIVGFPKMYPKSMLKLRVYREKVERIPEPVCVEIDDALKSWLMTKDKQLESCNSIELILRPILKWLDKQLEDLFTTGLKNYQKNIIAQQSGLQFVNSVNILKKSNDWTDESDSTVSEGGDDESSDGDDDTKFGNECSILFEEDMSNEMNKDMISKESMNLNIDDSRKGTEIRFKDLQLREQSGTLEMPLISIQILCNRCKSKTDLKSPTNRLNIINCSICNNELSLNYRSIIAHKFSSVIGYLDLNNCTPFDLILIDCELRINCLNCQKNIMVNGLIVSQIKTSWCRNCHSKLEVSVDSCRFTQLSTEIDRSSLEQHIVKVNRKRVEKNPAIKEGLPLPNNGTCKHYKKSYRWFRFPCCGKAYPCDICHDDNESHDLVLANRMICGFCCKEQQYSADKVCVVCSHSLTKKVGSHWEGGKGCRDQIKMSRNDSRKYSNRTKTMKSKKNIKK